MGPRTVYCRPDLTPAAAPPVRRLRTPGSDESNAMRDDEHTEARPWFEEAFAHGYLDVYPHRDLAAARAEGGGLVAGGLGGGSGGRVLDLGCGFGRHSLAMAEAGLDVTGLDLSADLLARAGTLEGGEALAGRLVRGDMRALPFAAAGFDAVVLLFSSFGYFDEAGNARVLDEVARVLRPGGVALFDLMNADRIRATLVPSSRTERDGRVLLERRRLEDFGRRVTKDVVLREADGTERHWREDVRMYGPAELAALLAPRGLAVERVDGDFDGRAAAPDSPRRIVWARRLPA